MNKPIQEKDLKTRPGNVTLNYRSYGLKRRRKCGGLYEQPGILA